jgi:hypothetical protein
LHVDICDRAFVLGERQHRSAPRAAQRFSLLHFQRISTTFHSPHATLSGHRWRSACERNDIGWGWLCTLFGVRRPEGDVS